MSETTSPEVPAATRAAGNGHELDTSPWMRVESTLMSTARLIREAYDEALVPLELNLTSGSLLAYVAEHGALTQTHLAERLGIGRAAAGTVVDRLEGRGLVCRTADRADRRVWLVEVTDTGRELAGQVAEVDERLRRRLRLGIDRHERQMLASLLVRVQKNLTRPNPEQPPAAT